MEEKEETLCWFLKKVTNKTSKNIVQSLFFQSVARFLNVKVLNNNMLKYFLDNNIIF